MPGFRPNPQGRPDFWSRPALLDLVVFSRYGLQDSNSVNLRHGSAFLDKEPVIECGESEEKVDEMDGAAV
jgi:hypothetical protein